jgi:hypothetical protein
MEVPAWGRDIARQSSRPTADASGSKTHRPEPACASACPPATISWASHRQSRAAELDQQRHGDQTPEAMIRRSLLILGVLYLTAAVTGHAKQRRGSIACGCHEDCWCKRPGLSLFRWVFPFRHTPR